MYKSPLSCKEVKTVHRNVVKILDRVTNSKCITNLLLVMCSHRDMFANPGIDEGGGGGVYSTGACCKNILRF